MEHFLKGLAQGRKKLGKTLFSTQAKRTRAGFITVTLIILTLTLGLHHYQKQQIYTVYLNGTAIGAVDDPAAVNLFVTDLTQKCGCLYDKELNFAGELELKKEFKKRGQADNEATLQAIRKMAAFSTEGYLLHIDGRPFLPLASEAEVAELESAVKDFYSASAAGGELQEVYIVEEIHAEACLTSPEELCTAQQALALLTGPKPLMAASGSEAELFAARPAREVPERAEPLSRSAGAAAPVATSSMLNIAQYLKQQQQQQEKQQSEEVPQALHVKTVEEVTVLEAVPFVTEQVEEHSLYLNESTVLEEGVEGEKEVLYRITRENGIETEREVLEETILTEPVTQIEATGTKELPQTFDGGGSFAWPVQGEGIIYNGYKPGHQAIDIHIAEGTGVLAAADGVVTFNGWGSTQGNYLIIHHGQYWTLYLHNSVNLVQVGDHVKRGQVIAKVGTTGRATGAHLHFEVRQDDGTRCWNSYYQHQKINPLQLYNRRE